MLCKEYTESGGRKREATEAVEELEQQKEHIDKRTKTQHKELNFKLNTGKCSDERKEGSTGSTCKLLRFSSHFHERKP